MPTHSTAMSMLHCKSHFERRPNNKPSTYLAIDPGGAMAEECWGDYSKKLALWRRSRGQFENFCADWSAVHRPRLAALVRSPQVVHAILARAGAPLAPQELEPALSQEEYDFAVQNGHFIRVRFVLADLLYFLDPATFNALASTRTEA
jgi:glycerol-1-phosphate dehydrogenase [NAD(P)+]